MNKDNQKFNFTIVYILEVLRTFGSGLLAMSTPTHLILELGYDESIGSVVSSLYFFGFLSFTLLVGHLSDKIGRRKVIFIVQLTSMMLGLVYIIPIRNTTNLVFFSIARFLDGGVNGLFWPTVQSYSIVAGQYGSKQKQKFLKGYNFGWNLGFLLGMIGGALFVYLTGDNYSTFIFSLSTGIISFILTIGFLKDVGSINNILIENFEKNILLDEKNKNQLDSSLVKKFGTIPMYYIIIMLVVHGFFDGGISIFSPLKTKFLAIASFWVFIIGFGKAICQTISIVIFSGMSDEKVLVRLIIVTTFLATTWLIMIFTNYLWQVILLACISGVFQGAIYACCMKLTTFKAQYTNSARPFSFYQATMGTGRMVGQLVIGFGATYVSLNAGIWILVIYDFIAISFFIIKMHKHL